jgi:hypothetical protein
MANKAAYVPRLTAAPAHNKKPVGAVAVGHINILPVGGEFAAEAATKAVVASCVVLVPKDAVGAVGVPVNTGDNKSALVAEEIAKLLNSVSSSAPFTILRAFPEGSVSLEVKAVLFT